MGWIPTSVEIEMESNALIPSGLTMKSTHVMIEGLSKDDIAKIDTAKKQWLGYAAVSLLKFRGIEQTTSAQAATPQATADQTVTAK